MFFSVVLFAILAPLVSALTVATPEGLTSGGNTTISWTNEAGDPNTFSIELINTVFNNAFAIANNVDPSSNSLTLTLPVVPPGDGYTVQLVNIGNITDVFASSATFSIGPTVSVSATGSSTSTLPGTASTGISTTGANTVTRPATTSVFGVTTTSGSTVRTSASGSSTGSAPASSSGSTTPNGALSYTKDLNMGLIAVMLLSAAAGAVIAL